MPSAYKYVKRKHHPLAPPSGRLPEHRVILYEKLGPGPQKCYWCGKKLVWTKVTRTEDGTVTTDHLDGNTWNNDPENLEPSCHTCNVERARDDRFEDAPYLIVAGVRQRATSRVCETCTEEFLVLDKMLRSAAKRGTVAGRFCSRVCRANRDRTKDVKRK